MSVIVLGLEMPKSCFSCYEIRRTRLKNCPINILCETNKHDEADKFLDEELIHMDCPLRPVGSTQEKKMIERLPAEGSMEG